MTSSTTQTSQRPAQTPAPLRSLKDFEGYKISATDGGLGQIHDFLFDDEFWIVRYVVVDTGHWLPGRKVLLPPGVLLDADWRKRSFNVALSRDQIKNSPDIDADKPVSRQREIELHEHFGWPYYWMPTGAWPGVITPPPPQQHPQKQEGDPHLRSVREVIGYDIHASDGDIGRVADFIAELDAWMVRYLVVTTHKWWPGKKVLISPQWLIGPISWSAHKVNIIMTRDSVKNSPEYDSAAPVNREYEAQLYDFYGRPRYWV